MQRRFQFNTTNPRLATSRATDVPYICLMVCWTAIRLLRDDPVASLVGSLASSASCLISRKPRCFPRRSIVFESSSSTERILHCTQNLGGRSRNKSGISCSLCSFSTKITRRHPSLLRPIRSLAVSKQRVARLERRGTHMQELDGVSVIAFSFGFSELSQPI